MDNQQPSESAPLLESTLPSDEQKPSQSSRSPEATPSLESTLPSDKQKPSQSSKRSPEATQRRNKIRHQKLKIKRQQHTIKRRLYHPWTLLEIKKYLKSRHIQYGRIPPIYRRILKINFNNQVHQDLADAQLEIDIFNENNYKEFIGNQPS